MVYCPEEILASFGFHHIALYWLLSNPPCVLVFSEVLFSVFSLFLSLPLPPSLPFSVFKVLPVWSLVPFFIPKTIALALVPFITKTEKISTKRSSWRSVLTSVRAMLVQWQEKKSERTGWGVGRKWWNGKSKNKQLLTNMTMIFEVGQFKQFF